MTQPANSTYSVAVKPKAPVKKRTVKPPKKNWRPSEQDVHLLETLTSHLGVAEADVLRMGIRKVADAEGIPRD